MKKNMLIVLALLMTFSSIFAMDIEIGTGTTTTNYLPLYGFYDYGWSNFVIDADLIGMEIEVNQIQFNVGNEPAGYASTNQQIYFKHTTEAVVPADYPNPESAGFTLVFDGDITWNGSGWQGVMLDTPFEYNGTDNLQIAWVNNDGSYANGYPNFYITDVATNVGAYDYADGAFPVEAGTNVTYFPNLKLGFAAENEPTMATLVAPENGSIDNATTTTLEWALGDNTTAVDVYFSNVADDVAGMSASAMVVDEENVTSYEATDLETLTTYFWRVVSHNTANDLFVNGPVWSFTTEVGGGIVAVPIGDGTTNDNKFPWNFYYKNSVAETIYLASELNIGGQMQGLTYYNTFVTDLPAMPVNIWVGETTQTDLSTYIPASELTPVFEGTVDFPAGVNSINIMFDTPYNYAGGNLVILTDRPLADEYYSSSDKFYNTATDLPNRTLSWQSDSVDFDPETVDEGTVTVSVSANMPNVTFYFITEGMGSVTGTVTDGTTGLAGVNLTIDGTSYQAMSSADGSFEFPYVAEAEDYTLTASLHGYYDGTATFDVTEDEETVVDVTITMLPNVEVTGQVITNDTSMGIQAHVMLTGYENYEADTDADGYFTIAGVYANQTYNGIATAEGYQAGSFQAVVADEDLDLGTILVTEILFQPSGAVATLDGDNVVVTWNEPSTSTEGEWITKGAEENNDGIGTGGAATFNFAHMYTQEELVAYQGMYINTIKIFPREASATYTIKIHGGADGNTELYSQDITEITNEVWNEFALDSSVAIPTTGPLYIGYYVDATTGYPGGCDAGPAVAGGDMVKMNGQADWDVLSDIADIDVNWNIQAYVSGMRGTEVASSPRRVMMKKTPVSAPKAQLVRGNLQPIANTINNSRAFEAYNVYRFLIEDEATMANWTLVEEETTDLTYTDTDWSTLESGFYKYAVKAVYTGGAESNASITNWLQNSDMSEVTFNIDSNLGDVIADATISLTSQAMNPDGEFDEYEVVTDAAGVATVSVISGMYDYTIVADGYSVHSDVVDASADATVNVTLDELALPVSGIVAVQTGSDAVITWNAPSGNGGGDATNEGFEDAFPPTDWTTVVTNTTQSWAQYETVSFTSGDIVPTEGMYQAGVMWDYSAQDEWLITGEMACPAGNLTFDFYGQYGSENADNYFVKISTDGTNWTALWNATDLPAAENHYDTPVVIDLSSYAGQNVQIAWNFVDGDGAGLWYATYIDNIMFGGTRIPTTSLTTVSKANNNNQNVFVKNTPKRFNKKNPNEVSTRVAPVQQPQIAKSLVRNDNRALLGYKVWRLLSTDQGNESNWTLLTADMITDLTYTDTDWDALDSGSYKFAVKAIYTNDNMSPAAFSNELLKDMYGTVDGMVMTEDGDPINGASVNLDGTMTTTDGSGYFLFTDVLAGEYNISASAAGYVASTETITVVGTQLTTIDFNLAASDILISDSFESYTDFSLEAGAWTMVDGDLSDTYTITNTEFLNAGSPMAYIVFNPLMTTPALAEEYYAYDGSKYLTTFASMTPENNDWVISEEFTLGASGTFNFWGKSITDQYGLERFNVLVSNGSTNPNDFTSISGASYVEAATDWTQYSYGLDAYANQTIRVAIQCVSDDAFMFMVDQIEIDAPGGTDNENNDIPAVSTLVGNYPNPFNPETTISFSTKENGPVSIDIYNIRGQKVKALVNDNMQAGPHSVVWNGTDDNGKNVASGVFFYRMKSGKYSSTKKMILMK